MFTTIQQNWNEPDFLSFGQRILVIVSIFLIAVILGSFIKKRNLKNQDFNTGEMEEVVGFTPFDEQDVLGLNRRETFGENRVWVKREESDEERLQKNETHRIIKFILIAFVFFIILSYLRKFVN